MDSVQAGYSYKGFVYNVDREYEEDNIKLFHSVTTELPSRVNINLDWSPYSTPTVKDFELWIDLNMPKRVNSGPLTHQDLMGLLEGYFNGK